MPSTDRKANEDDVRATFKEVVVVGNGPSAITLSYFLSGNAPYYTGETSDDLLHLRLRQNPGDPLAVQDLGFLSQGLEGRSTNPVSVLFDALTHPDADLGVESPSLLSWEKRDDLAVNHVVLGKDLPGGAWRAMAHNLESNILTVSLGSWMDLPGLTMSEWSNTEVGKRVNVSMVADYYKEYVRFTGLEKNFVDRALVTSVEKVNDYSSLWMTNEQKEEKVSRQRAEEDFEVFQFSFDEHQPPSNPIVCRDRKCSLESASPCSTCSTFTPDRGSPFRDSFERLTNERFVSEDPHALSQTPAGILMIERARQRAMTKCCLKIAQSDEGDCVWNPIVNPSLFHRQRNRSAAYSTNSLSVSRAPLPKTLLRSSSLGCWETDRAEQNEQKKDPDANHLWEVSGVVLDERGAEVRRFKYLTKNVVLACGSDKPNRLSIPGESLPFVLHSLNDLERRIGSGEVSSADPDPVLIVGAGLSAADAVIAAMENNLKVIHIFRRDVNDKGLILKDLPRKVYPEYHEIHQLMSKGTGYGGRYTALERRHLMEIHPDRAVKFHGENGVPVTVRVSFVLVLIGARPNLDFLVGDRVSGENIGVIPGSPVSKTNLVDINIFTGESVKHKGLYAMGPLVGDNFVRFLQGGALAITNDILMKRNQF